MCEIILGYKVGVLCGTSIYGHRNTQNARDEAVAGLNAKKLDGIILSERVGGCGHNLVGANHTYFMGSLYSQSYEDQVNGTLVYLLPPSNFSRPHVQEGPTSYSGVKDHSQPVLHWRFCAH